MADNLKNNAEPTVLDFAGSSLTKYVSGMENYPFPPSISVEKLSLDVVGSFEKRDKYPSGYQVLAEENADKTPVADSTSNINPALVEHCSWYQSA